MMARLGDKYRRVARSLSRDLEGRNVLTLQRYPLPFDGPLSGAVAVWPWPTGEGMY